MEADFLGCHLQLCARSAGWQQLLVFWWTLLCAAASCIQVISPPRLPSTVLSFPIPVEDLLLARTDKSRGMSQSRRWCIYLKNCVFLWTPIAEPPFQPSTLIKLCCAQGNLLFKIQWKWGHWKLIILMHTALWAFACYWNDFTKRNSNEGWIGGEDKLFPSHFPNDRPAAM